jgi:hypothetical protein
MSCRVAVTDNGGEVFTARYEVHISLIVVGKLAVAGAALKM